MRIENNIPVSQIEKDINDTLMYSYPRTIYIDKHISALTNDRVATSVICKLAELSGSFDSTVISAYGSSGSIAMKTEQPLGYTGIIAAIYKLRLAGYTVESLSYIRYGSDGEIIKLGSMHNETDTFKISIDDRLIPLVRQTILEESKQQNRVHAVTRIYAQCDNDLTEYLRDGFICTYGAKQIVKATTYGIDEMTVLVGDVGAILERNSIIIANAVGDKTTDKFISNITSKYSEDKFGYTLIKSKEIYMF